MVVVVISGSLILVMAAADNSGVVWCWVMKDLLHCYYLEDLGRRKERMKEKKDTNSWRSATTRLDIMT